MLERTCEKLESPQTFPKLSQTHAAFSHLVFAPAHGPLGPKLGDAQFEAADVQRVADPLRLDTAPKLVPGHGVPMMTRMKRWRISPTSYFSVLPISQPSSEYSMVQIACRLPWRKWVSLMTQAPARPHQ